MEGSRAHPPRRRRHLLSGALLAAAFAFQPGSGLAQGPRPPASPNPGPSPAAGPPNGGRIVAPGVTVLGAPTAARSPEPPLVQEIHSSPVPGMPQVKLVKTPQGTFAVEVPASPSPGPAGAAQAGSEEAQVREVERARDKYSQAISNLNSANPQSEQFGQAPADPNSPDAERARQLQRLINHPWVKRYREVYQNPRFIEAVNLVLEHPRKRWLLYAELALVVLALALRSWRLHYARSWLKRIWINTWVGALFVALAFGALPLALIGEPYLKVMSGLAQGALSGVQKQ